MFGTIGKMMGNQSAKTAKAMLTVFEAQIDDQIGKAKGLFAEILDSEELKEEEKELFTELNTNIDLTVGTVKKILGLLTVKIDEESTK